MNSDQREPVAVHCAKCNILLGHISHGRLVLLSGASVRFPFTIQCTCGVNIRWAPSGHHSSSEPLDQPGDPDPEKFRP